MQMAGHRRYLSWVPLGEAVMAAGTQDQAALLWLMEEQVGLLQLRRPASQQWVRVNQQAHQIRRPP